MSIKAKIVDIKKHEQLTKLVLNASGIELVIISLELDESIKIGSKVELLVKATNVLISKKPLEKISVQNQFPAKITNIERGEILVNISLDFCGNSLESILLKNSFINLNLQEEDIVNVFINSSDISILRVLNA